MQQTSNNSETPTFLSFSNVTDSKNKNPLIQCVQRQIPDSKKIFMKITTKQTVYKLKIKHNNKNQYSIYERVMKKQKFFGGSIVQIQSWPFQNTPKNIFKVSFMVKGKNGKLSSRAGEVQLEVNDIFSSETNEQTTKEIVLEILSEERLKITSLGKLEKSNEGVVQDLDEYEKQKAENKTLAYLEKQQPEKLFIEVEPSTLNKEDIKKIFEEEGGKIFQLQLNGQKYLDHRKYYLVQGLYGNCYLIAVLDQILFKADFIFDFTWLLFDEKNHRALCKIDVNGRKNTIEIDFQIPFKEFDGFRVNLLKTNDLNFSEDKIHIRHAMCILFEKATAIVFNGFQNLQGGYAYEAFKWITGCSSVVQKSAQVQKYLPYLEKWAAEKPNQKRQSTHLITLSIRKEQQQENIEQINNFFIGGEQKFGPYTKHSYSVRKLYYQSQKRTQQITQNYTLEQILQEENFDQTNPIQKNQEVLKKIFLIVANPNGKQEAQQFNRRSKQVKDLKQQWLKKMKKMNIYENQMVLSFYTISKLNADFTVCKFKMFQEEGEYKPFKITSDTICFHSSQYSNNYVIKIPSDHKGQLEVFINHFEKRILKQSPQYPFIMFELEVVVNNNKKYYRYFWEKWEAKNHVSFSYPFDGGYQTEYRIRVAMIDQKNKFPKFCQLLVSSTSSETLLRIDEKNPNFSEQKLYSLEDEKGEISTQNSSIRKFIKLQGFHFHVKVKMIFHWKQKKNEEYSPNIFDILIHHYPDEHLNHEELNKLLHSQLMSTSKIISQESENETTSVQYSSKFFVQQQGQHLVKIQFNQESEDIQKLKENISHIEFEILQEEIPELDKFWSESNEFDELQFVSSEKEEFKSVSGLSQTTEKKSLRTAHSKTGTKQKYQTSCQPTLKEQEKLDAKQ